VGIIKYREEFSVKLTPLDIRKQEFKKVVRGFDVEEVETFLDMVSEQFENLLHEKRQMNEEIVKLQTQLRDYQQVESALKETLMNAQQNINQSRETSKKEAEIIVREAELKAEEILDNTKSKLLDMKNELLLLKSQKDSFVKRLKQLIQSQVELIDVLSIDDLSQSQQDNEETAEPEAHIIHENAKSIQQEPRIIGLKEKQEATNPQPEDNPSKESNETADGSSNAQTEDKNNKLSDEFIV
jgi:cell division initiation protein